MQLLKIFVFLLVPSLIIFSSNRNDESTEVEKRIREIVSQMTVEEKVGQMTQITLDVIAKDSEAGNRVELDVEKLNEAIKKYKVGSILNLANELALKLDNWQEIITQIQDAAIENSRFDIPVLYGVDAIHGTNYILGGTITPQAIALAATRNREIVRKASEITAYETRASGIPWNFNPVLGVGREPLWSRLYETFGEDSYLVSQMGIEYVKGHHESSFGNNANVMSCAKHYLGYSVPKNGNDRTPAYIGDRQLKDIFLPPFESAIKAGSNTVMVNSAEINGIPVHSNYKLLTEVLKGDLGLTGFVVSDWADIVNLHVRDRIAETPKEAVKIGVMAGLDMSMVPSDYSFFEYLVELVNDGEVPMDRIDDAVTRILRVKFECGLFENAYADKSLEEGFASDDFQKVNLNAARESITLLKNENKILPLSKDKKVLVTGPTSNLLSALNGGWTITWQGGLEKHYPQYEKTVLEAIENKIGKENITFYEGISFEKDINSMNAIDAIRNVDAVILCLGEFAYAETPGNITNLALPKIQLEYAKKVIASGKPVVIVLLEGRPRVFTEVAQQVDGIITGYLPGMKGGLAIAEVLFGDYNPSGRLPYTYPRDVNGYTTYDYKPLENYNDNKFNPLFEFGHGLSYTTFEYNNLEFSDSVMTESSSLSISVHVTNSGDRDGKVSVELYLTDLYGSVSRPNKSLKGFEKIFLKKGETKTVSFLIHPQDLSFIGRDNSRIVEPGKFIVNCGGLNGEFELK